MVVSVCVVGGGVVGLTTATFLQDALPAGSSVTVVADKFLTETTSDGAAGIFRPGLQFQGSSPALTRQWIQDSYQFYTRLLNSPDAAITGVRRLSGYFFSNKHPELVWNDFLKEVLQEYRPCTQVELDLHGHKYGTFATTLLTECRRYLPYLTSRFRNKGGVVKRRHLESLEELAGHYDVVCNCSGMGAKKLVGDLTVTPIRGQVYKVRAPWINNFYYNDNDTYVLPGMELVTLGGTRQFDSYNTEVCQHDSRAIWERCVELLPSLKDAEVVREWVGQRPYRPSVRVEKEVMDFGDGKRLKVVHHYGHGGYGVLSSPGTSMYAVKLVQELLDQPKSKL